MTGLLVLTSHLLTICPPVQLHNSLIIAILGSSLHHAPPTPPPDAPGKGKHPKKRKRTALYGPDGADDDAGAARSARLKRWAVNIGKKERERVKAFETASSSVERRLRKEVDEIARERGVVLLPEGRGEFS